jgi:hypothetical protein
MAEKKLWNSMSIFIQDIDENDPGFRLVYDKFMEFCKYQLKNTKMRVQIKNFDTDLSEPEIEKFIVYPHGVWCHDVYPPRFLKRRMPPF